MTPDVDVLFEWQAPFKPVSISRARVYRTTPRTVLILSETPANQSYSLINGMEIAVQQAIAQFELVPSRLLCIEHLPAGCPEYRGEDEFSLVWFSYNPRTRTLEAPKWYRLDATEVDSIVAGSDAPMRRILQSVSEPPRFFEA